MVAVIAAAPYAFETCTVNVASLRMWVTKTPISIGGQAKTWTRVEMTGFVFGQKDGVFKNIPKQTVLFSYKTGAQDLKPPAGITPMFIVHSKDTGIAIVKYMGDNTWKLLDDAGGVGTGDIPSNVGTADNFLNFDGCSYSFFS